ncbi:Ras-induced vulval development antagonist protein [Rhynchospora pubera]|uniref:Ras-induced vulval development antagonist protein n=1 Tax=Rhynchospora pubera TaxID=906938 RepID=A0AAV8G9T0_9POAL|nr:Ras-induced vulval development antagonist protein [Rhynchospora pubera]
MRSLPFRLVIAFLFPRSAHPAPLFAQMGRDRDRADARRHTKRLSSVVEVSKPRSRVSRSPRRDPRSLSPSPRWNRRSDSPSPRHRRAGSPYYRDSRRNWSPYHDRSSRDAKQPFRELERVDRNGSGSEEDDELKGLTYFEYRRVKRQKLRKQLRNCIWNVTPSPPRGERDGSEQYDEENGLSDVLEKEKVPRKAKSESEGSESESDDSMKDRRRKRSNRERSRRRKRYSDSSEDASESLSDEDSSEESDQSSEEDVKSKRKSARSRRGSSHRKSRSSRKRSNKSRKVASSDEDSEYESGESDQSEDSGPRNKRSRSLDKKGIITKHKKKDAKSDKSESEPDTKKGELKKPEAVDPEALKFKELIEAQKKPVLDNEPMVGPTPLPRAEGHISYGGALRPGEGDAIAQYVQQGKRIPRRGEVGLSADEIQKFEGLGYVMSGSRHQRMNAIRIRKENQVYSAEDKRALAMFNYEEKSKREHKVMADLQRLVQRHIGQDTGTGHDPFGTQTDGADV